MTGLITAKDLWSWVQKLRHWTLLKPNKSQHEFRFFENGCGTDFLDVQMFGSWLKEQGDAFHLQFKNFAFPGQYSGWFPNGLLSCFKFGPKMQGWFPSRKSSRQKLGNQQRFNPRVRYRTLPKRSKLWFALAPTHLSLIQIKSVIDHWW